MTDAGRAVLPDMSEQGFVIDAETLKVLQAGAEIWENFQKFPFLYQRGKIDTIQIKKKQPELFKSRLQKLLDNTKAGVMYGEWNDNGRLKKLASFAWEDASFRVFIAYMRFWGRLINIYGTYPELL